MQYQRTIYAGYMFYEDTQGFNFRSFESMMAKGGHTARPVIEAYAMQPAKIRTPDKNIDIEKDLQSPDSYSFVDVVNTLEEVNSGLYANRLVTHDIYHKQIQTFDYDYHEKLKQKSRTAPSYVWRLSRDWKC